MSEPLLTPAERDNLILLLAALIEAKQRYVGFPSWGIETLHPLEQQVVEKLDTLQNELGQILTQQKPAPVPDPLARNFIGQVPKLGD